MSITDPVSGRAALLLLQTDITIRAELEARMAALTESQLAMLEQMFPRCGGHHCLDATCACTRRQFSTDAVRARKHLCLCLRVHKYFCMYVCASQRVWSAAPPKNSGSPGSSASCCWIAT